MKKLFKKLIEGYKQVKKTDEVLEINFYIPKHSKRISKKVFNYFTFSFPFEFHKWLDWSKRDILTACCCFSDDSRTSLHYVRVVIIRTEYGKFDIYLCYLSDHEEDSYMSVLRALQLGLKR